MASERDKALKRVSEFATGKNNKSLCRSDAAEAAATITQLRSELAAAQSDARVNMNALKMTGEDLTALKTRVRELLKHINSPTSEWDQIRIASEALQRHPDMGGDK